MLLTAAQPEAAAANNNFLLPNGTFFALLVVFLIFFGLLQTLVVKPFTLALRLFGNIFSGTILIALIGLFPAWLLWAPTSVWKIFDLFIGVIQAFIFALLTILYFSFQLQTEEGH